MNSEPQVPSISIDRPISWDDWLKGRRFRRESSSSDKRLRHLFNGERGLPFTPTEKL